jgi:hypothetical protein
MRAAYQTAQATTNSDRTQTQTGINERASARRVEWIVGAESV